MSSHTEDCIFCSKTNCKVISSTKHFFVIRDTAYPVTKHHTLIITKRHIPSYFQCNSEEIKEIPIILNTQREELILEDKTITGFNIGMNIGEDAGQTIFHFHMHIIPRMKGDLKNPKGGVLFLGKCGGLKDTSVLTKFLKASRL